MEHRRCVFLFAVLFKLALSISILALLVTPTELKRRNLSTNGTEHEMIYFNSVTFKIHHHFCSIPKQSGLVRKTKEALDLPNGTVVGESLAKFGRCRAEFLHLKQDTSPCLCNTNPAYVALIFVSSTSVVINFLHFTARIVLGGYETTMAFFGTVVWLIMTVIEIVFHAVASSSLIDYELWLPNEMHERTYFLKSIKWTSTILFSALYVVIGVVEFYSLNPSEPDQPDDVYESQNVSKCRRLLRNIARFIDNNVCRLTLFGSENEADEYEIPKRSSVWHRVINMGKYRVRKKPHFNKTWP